VIAALTLKHWEALKRALIQIPTLPDPQIQFQEFTVGSPSRILSKSLTNVRELSIIDGEVLRVNLADWEGKAVAQD
jgi:hypothetical protein